MLHEDSSDRGVRCRLARELGSRTRVRDKAAMAIKCGGYNKHSDVRYVSLIMNLRVLRKAKIIASRQGRWPTMRVEAYCPSIPTYLHQFPSIGVDRS